MTAKRILRPRGKSEVQWQRYAIQQAMLAALVIPSQGRVVARKGKQGAGNIRKAARVVSCFYASIDESVSVATARRYWRQASDPPSQEPTEFVDRGIPLAIRVAARMLCVRGEYVTPAAMLAWYRKHLHDGGAPIGHSFCIARAFVESRKK